MLTKSEIVADAPMESRNAIAIAVYMVLLASYFINAMDRPLFAVLAVEVRQALSLDLKQIGFASTGFTLGMGVAGIPTAMLFKRMSRKTVSLVGLVIFSVATILTAYAGSYPELLLQRFLSGVGESMQMTAIIAIGTSFFHNNKGVATGALNFTFGMGAVVGPNLAAFLLHNYSWQTPFVWFGSAGFIILMFVTAWVKPWFTEQGNSRLSSSAVSNAPAESPLEASTPSTYVLMICAAFAGLIVYGYLGMYPTYLRSALHFSPQDAAFALSFYGFGAFFSLIGGWIGDRFDFRKVLTFAFFVTAISGAALFSGWTDSIVIHSALSAVFGATASGVVFVNLAAGIIRSMRSSASSNAVGLYVASFYIPAAFAGYFLALLKENFGWGVAGLVQFTLLSFIGAVLLSFVKANGERRVK